MTRSLPAYTGEEPCQRGDPERWFPQPGQAGRKVKAECRGCPLVDACLDYALHVSVEGIWGGTSTVERQKLRGRLHIIPEPLVLHGLDDAPRRMDKDQVLRMAARGLSAAAIAELLDTSGQVIRRILRAAEAAA